MNIQSVDIFVTSPFALPEDGARIKPFLFVSLRDSDGTTGWGEAFCEPENVETVITLVRSISHSVVGSKLTGPRDFRERFAQPYGVDFDQDCACSAIEIGLWDLLGKQLGAPVRTLLGGALRQEIPLYANTWRDNSEPLEALYRRCQTLVDEGFGSVKVYPLKYGGTAMEAGQCVKGVRETVGDGNDIMLDLALPGDLKLALETAEAVKPYRPYWFEEPETGDHPEQLALIRRDTGLRIVTGEKHSGINHFRRFLETGACDILNPDICACGVLTMLDVAAMADTYGVGFSPHCWNSMTVAFAAMLEVCAVTPGVEPAEYFPDYAAHRSGFCQPGFAIADGSAVLGNAPGLGLVMDENRLSGISTTITVP